MKLVIKLSGKVLEDRNLAGSLCRQVVELTRGGYSLLLVHGGGKQLTDFCRRLDLPVIQHQGRRVTDDQSLEAAVQIFSSINRKLTAHLNSEGGRAVGMAAFDGVVTKAYKRPPLAISEANGQTEIVDFGWVGEIEAVDAGLLELLWSRGYIPVISCLCADSRGQILNINADTLASELALAVQADRLISISDVDGIYLDPADPSTKISSMDLKMARYYLGEGVFWDGMIPKVENAMRILEKGVGSFQVLSGLQEDALLKGIKENSGTLLCP